MSNKALEQAGSERRMNPLSFEAQGLERMPEIHLGPAASAMERRGVRTERGDQNREIQNLNALITERDEQKRALERLEAQFEKGRTKSAAPIGAEGSSQAKKDESGSSAAVSSTAPKRVRKLRDDLTVEQLETLRGNQLRTIQEVAQKIAEPELKRLGKVQTEKRKSLEARTAEAVATFQEIKANSPERGMIDIIDRLFGVGYETRKAAWEADCKAAEVREQEAKKALDAHERQAEAERKQVLSKAQAEAERLVPPQMAAEMKEVKTRIAQERAKQEAQAAEQKRDERIATLHKWLDGPIMSPVTAGGSGQIKYAQEIIKLEREKGWTDDEIAKLHPRASEVLQRAARYERGRNSKGLGR
jgi:hypothetical protein